MSGTPISKSRIDRALGVIARFGLDLRPFAQHLRAAIIRPVRFELAQSAEALRYDLAQLAAKNDELAAQLAQTIAKSNAFETQALAFREEIAGLQAAAARARDEAAQHLEAARSALERELQTVATDAARTAGELPAARMQLSAMNEH